LLVGAVARTHGNMTLKHDLAGYWFRRITDDHRLVYKIAGDEVRVAACRYHYW
jgi:toxin YoeB